MMYGEWRWFADSALRFLIKSVVIIVDDLLNTIGNFSKLKLYVCIFIIWPIIIGMIALKLIFLALYN